MERTPKPETYNSRCLVELTLKEGSSLDPAPPVIRNQVDLYSLFKHIGRRTEEELWIAHLDAQNRVQGRQMVTRGALNTVRTHPRELFRAAILNGAAAIVMAHNHPSGALEVSRDDIDFTRSIAEAGKLIGITLHDHLVISGTGFVSLKERGIL